MKMRKIISLFAAMTMAVSAFAALTVNASAASPKIEVACEKVEDFSKVLSKFDWREYGQDTYLLTFSVTNLPLEITVSGKSSTLAGTSIIGATLQCSVSADGDFDDAWTIGSNSYILKPTVDMYNNDNGMYTMAMVGTDPLSPNKASLDGQKGTFTVSETDKIEVAQVAVCVTPGQPVVLNFTADTVVQTGTFSADAIKSSATYPITIDPITVGGGTSKTDVEFTTASDATDAVNGLYTQGFLASATVADTNNAVAAVKFDMTATKGNDTDNQTKDVALGTTVEAGTIKVALNIRNVPEDITITLNSATPVAPVEE